MKREFVQAYRKLAQSGEAPSFIFIGDSLLHVASLNAFLDYTRTGGRKIRGIVCNGIPPERTVQFDENDLVFLDKNDYIYLFNRKDVDLREYAVESILDPTRAYLQMIRREPSDPEIDPRTVKDMFYILHPSTRAIRGYTLDFALSLGRPVTLVTLDEGIGTYVQDSATWFELAIAKTKSPLLRAAKRVRWVLQTPARKAQHTLLPKVSNHVSFCIFDETNRERAVTNEVSKPHYVRSFAEIGRQRGCFPRDYSGVVIIASSQFEEFGVEDFEVTFLDSIIRIVKACGYEALIKPHPRNADSCRYNSLEAFIDRKGHVSLESEMSLCSNPPVAILSFMSSAQVNSSALWGIPGISLSRIAASQIVLAGGDKDRVDHFLGTMGRAELYFDTFSQVPNNLNELRQILESLG